MMETSDPNSSELTARGKRMAKTLPSPRPTSLSKHARATEQWLLRARQLQRFYHDPDSDTSSTWRLVSVKDIECAAALQPDYRFKASPEEPDWEVNWAKTARSLQGFLNHFNWKVFKEANSAATKTQKPTRSGKAIVYSQHDNKSPEEQPTDDVVTKEEGGLPVTSLPGPSASATTTTMTTANSAQHQQQQGTNVGEKKQRSQDLATTEASLPPVPSQSGQPLPVKSQTEARDSFSATSRMMKVDEVGDFEEDKSDHGAGDATGPSDDMRTGDLAPSIALGAVSQELSSDSKGQTHKSEVTITRGDGIAEMEGRDRANRPSYTAEPPRRQSRNDESNVKGQEQKKHELPSIATPVQQPRSSARAKGKAPIRHVTVEEPQAMARGRHLGDRRAQVEPHAKPQDPRTATKYAYTQSEYEAFRRSRLDLRLRKA